MKGNSKAISIRYEAVKGQAATGCIAHQLRTGRLPSYVDRDRIAQNTTMIFRQTSPAAMKKELEDSRKSRGQSALRKDAKIFIDSIITFGTDAQEILAGLDKDAQDKMFLQVAQDQQKEHGHELLQLVIHRDEQALHAHALFRASRLENGKEKSWTYNKKDFSRFQDIAADSVKDLGIQRGHKKSERLRNGASWKDVTHRTVRELHAEMEADYATAREIKRQKKLLLNQPRPKPLSGQIKTVITRTFPFIKRVRVVPQSHVKAYQKRLADWQVQKVAGYAAQDAQARQKLQRLIERNRQLNEDLSVRLEQSEVDIEFARETVQKIIKTFGVSPDDIQRVLANEITPDELGIG